MSDALSAAALALFEARRNARPLTAIPPEWVPQTLDDAYKLQDAVMRLEGPAGGWKILAGGQGEPLCAPIPRSRYHDNGVRLEQAALMIVLTEVEVAVTLGQTLAPKGSAYTPADAAGAIVSLHPALEMCASAFAAALEAPHLLKMGDLQSNAAVIVGAGLPAPGGLDLTRLNIDLRYDGAAVASTAEGASWEQILAAIAWLANHAISRGLTLNAGDVIITGARLKHEATGPASITAQVGDMAPVQLTLI